MELLLPRAFAQATTKAFTRPSPVKHATWVCSGCRVTKSLQHGERRSFTSTAVSRVKEKENFSQSTSTHNSYTQPAAEVSQNETQAERNHFDKIEQHSKDKQMKSPWMREGSEKPPVARLRSAGAMTKGKLLTTPSRMLKLILPLTTRDANKDRKDVEPLALLVHPQQPLSYLERLIQSEIPAIEKGGKEQIPSVFFKAQDATEEDIGSGTTAQEKMEGEEESEESEDASDEFIVDGKKEKTGKIKSSAEGEELPSTEYNHAKPRASPTTQDPDHANFVRWSPSTEIGDFIRDAARSKEFAVEIEGTPAIYVGVPSFDDRTYYLRSRLKKTARRISELADIKQECDQLAKKGAQRVAQGGFMALIGWWCMVYYLTFKTDLGWDVMEPVTYLVGLSGLMGGYMWFLYHNREVSYRSAMNFTVSRRQSQLYEKKGFNLHEWELLVEEGNRLRREIKMVADEYDVDWREYNDAYDEKVSEALRRERKKNGQKDKDDKKDDKGDDE